MVSPLTRLQSLFPGNTPRAMPPRIIPATPEQSRALQIANAKAKLEASRGRPAPSTEEKIPSAYHHGIAGKIWFLPVWDSTTQDTPEIRAAMRLMRRDGYVKAAWEPQILSVAAEDYQVQPSEPGNPEAEEQAKFCRTVIDDYFAGGMPQLVRAVCSALGSDGHSVSEKVFQYAERAKLQGKIILEKAKTKDTSESGFGVIRLEGDQFGNVTSVQCRRTQDRWSINDFIYARYLTVFDEPLGEAAFRPAYGPYWMRDTVRKLRIIHTEKKMAGMLVGTYEDDQDKSPLEQGLQKAKTATWLSIPSGTRVEAVRLSTASEPDYKSFDESLRDEIVTAIAFAPLQQLVGGGGADVRGDAEVQKKISDLGPWLLMMIVQDTVNNQVFPDLIDFNFPYAAAGGYPKLTFGSVSSKEILEQQQAVVEAMTAGLKPSKKYYAKAWSIQQADPHDPDDEMKPPAQPGQPGAPGAQQPGGGDKPPVSLPFKFSEEVRSRITLPEVMQAMVSRLGWPSCLKFAEDDKGHEHKGKGPGGGEFTSKGGGGGDSAPEPAKAPEKPPAATSPAPAATSAAPAPKPAESKQDAIPAHLKSDKLFLPGELALPKKTNNAYSNGNDLYAAAAKTKPTFDVVLNTGKGVDKMIGATAVHATSYDDYMNALHKPGNVVIIGGIKGMKRAQEKVDTMGGDWSKLHDVVRGTVGVDSIDSIPAALGAVREAMAAKGWSIAQQPKNKFEEPTDAGYRDLNLVFKTPEGMTGEIQINTKAMLRRKEEAHKLYEQSRTIEPKVEAGTAMPDEKKQYHLLLDQQKKIYDSAWAESQSDKGEHASHFEGGSREDS